MPSPEGGAAIPAPMSWQVHNKRNIRHNYLTATRDAPISAVWRLSQKHTAGRELALADGGRSLSRPFRSARRAKRNNTSITSDYWRFNMQTDPT